MNAQKRVRDDLKNVPLYSTCSRAELALIVERTTPVRFAAGSCLAAEGAVGREFIVIAEGSAIVTIRGHPVATLGPGSIGDEIALLDGGRHTTTVTALTDGMAYVTSAREFPDLLEGAPHLAHRMLVEIAHRLRSTDLMLDAVISDPTGPRALP